MLCGAKAPHDKTWFKNGGELESTPVAPPTVTLIEQRTPLIAPVFAVSDERPGAHYATESEYANMTDFARFEYSFYLRFNVAPRHLYHRPHFAHHSEQILLKHSQNMALTRRLSDAEFNAMFEGPDREQACWDFAALLKAVPGLEDPMDRLMLYTVHDQKVYRGPVATRATAERRDLEGRRRSHLIHDDEKTIEINEGRFEEAEAKYFAALHY